MLTLTRRYAHVPLGIVSVLLVVAVIAWLIERHADELWDPARRIAAPVPAAVTIATISTPAAAAPVPDPPVPAVRPAPAPPVSTVPAPPPASPPVPAPEAPIAAAPPIPVVAPPQVAATPPERYALESGPFGSAEAADRIEDQLNHFGYATVRFRKQEVRRLYVVTVATFGSARDARRAAADLGRGTVVEGGGGIVLQVDRLLSMGEAVAAARQVRERGYDVRVDEDLSPAVIYHVRYGQFPTQAAAEARGDELALFGVASRVVKVR